MKTMTLGQHHTAEELAERFRNIKDENGNPLYPVARCREFIGLVNEINEVKQKTNAVILAHSYVLPEITYGVADFSGDSYALSKDAARTEAERIVFAGVRFMGETAKILSPKKEVLLPAADGGCSLADSITAEQVRALREEFPDFTFVCYINTTADVKALCDVCVTSGNVDRIVERIPSDKIYFLPDRNMGQNLIRILRARGVEKDIRYFDGACHAHEKFDLAQIREARQKYPDVKIISHPECFPVICEASDFVGSTGQIMSYIATSPDRRFLILTERGLLERIQVEFPDKELVGAAHICEYMKSNTLESILRVLTASAPKDRVLVDEAVRLKAKKCIDAMFYYAEKP